MLLSAAGLAVQGIVQETHPRLHGIHWLLYASNPLDGDTSLSSRLRLLDDTGAKHASRTKVCWSGYILSHTWDDGYVIFSGVHYSLYSRGRVRQPKTMRIGTPLDELC